MPKIELIAQSLTREAFKSYGDVVEINEAFHFSMNEETIERYHDLAQIDIGDDPDAKVIFSITQCTLAAELPYIVDLVERHPLGSQLFYPLFNGPMIAVVGDRAEQPVPMALKAFVSNGKQGINFYRNVWHMPLIGLNAEEKFIIIDRDGPGNNCDKYYFDENLEITLHTLC